MTKTKPPPGWEEAEMMTEPHCEFCDRPPTWIHVPTYGPWEYGCRLSCDRHRHLFRLPAHTPYSGLPPESQMTKIDETKPPPGWAHFRGNAWGDLYPDEEMPEYGGLDGFRSYEEALAEAHRIARKLAAPYVAEERAEIAAWLRLVAAASQMGAARTLRTLADRIERGDHKEPKQ